MLRRLLGALALALAASSATAQDTKVKFILDWRFEGPAALFLQGVPKGYYKQEKLDVQIDVGSGSAAAVSRVAAGAYDIGFADINTLMEFIGANPQLPSSARPVAVYMLYSTMPGVVLALKKSGIKEPKDLEGKTLGSPVFDANRKAFPIFARAAGIDPAKVSWKSMDPPLREVMLSRGEVDGVTSFQFVGQLALNKLGHKDEDLTIMRYRDYGANLYSSAVIVNPKFLQEKPEAVRAFLRAVTKTVQDVAANPAASIQSVADRDPLIDRALETRRLIMCLDMAVVTEEAKANGLGAVNKLRLERNIDQVVAAFGIKSPVVAEGLFDSSYLPPRSERQIK
jgi:NitT/TauT family transport system substrate-binding protein